MTIRLGTVCDWPAIDAMRRAYFASVDRAHYPADDETRWYVAENDDQPARVCGTFGYIDRDDTAWVTDFYRVAGREGVRAAATMARALRGMAIGFTVDPANEAWRAHVERARGELVGLIYRVAARGANPCPQP